ncbi:MAG: septum formation initiator family protein [Acutalibacteraceae bacterium]|nr:septum formation initiator family protein [Acutalibacteraceae bacterium]
MTRVNAKKNKAQKANAAVKTQKSKRKTHWILYIAVVALVIYVAVTIVEQNVKIQNAKETLSHLDNKISIQKIELSELKSVADSAEKKDYDSVADYIEKIAREEMDYVKSGEVVYINIAGN